MYSNSSKPFKGEDPKAHKWRLWSLVILLGLCFNLVILSSVIYYGATDLGFYAKEFKKLDSTTKTGLSQADLDKVSKRLADYVGLKTTTFSEKVTIEGKSIDFFNDKERAHMVDVQRLFWFDLKVGLVMAALCLGLWGFNWKAFKAQDLWGRVFVSCGIVTLVIGGFLGLLMATDFSSAFIKFHKLFFTNDLWLLDPATDRMIVLLEETFFADIAAHIVLLYGGLTAFITAFGVILLKRKRAQ